MNFNLRNSWHNLFPKQRFLIFQNFSPCWRSLITSIIFILNLNTSISFSIVCLHPKSTHLLLAAAHAEQTQINNFKDQEKNKFDFGTSFDDKLFIFDFREAQSHYDEKELLLEIEILEQIEQSISETDPNLPIHNFSCVALGGSFDHYHMGHNVK